MKLAIFTSVFAVLSLTFAAPVPDAEIEARSVAKFYPSLAVNIFTPDKGTVKGDVYVFRVRLSILPPQLVHFLTDA